MRAGIVLSVSFITALAACNGEDKGDSDGQTPSPEGEISASCAPTDNPLRFSCSAALTAEEATTWTIWEGETLVRTLSAAPSAAPVIGLWGLAPATSFRFEVETSSGTSTSGEIATGPLPESVAALTMSLTGAPVSLDHLAVKYRCNGASGLALFGADGVLRWYEPLDVAALTGIGPTSGLVAFDWSPDDDIVAVLDGDRIARFDPMGVRQFEVGGFERPLHHDVAIHGDNVIALSAYEANGFVLDGMYILDATGATIGTWNIDDVLTVTGSGIDGPFWDNLWPEALDWSHSNGVTPDGPGYVLLSSRWLDSVLRVNIDPALPAFGTIDWILTGHDNDRITGDYTWTDGGGFVGQHHAARRPGGGISVFDNAADGVISRALLIDIDETTKTASEATSWPMLTHCSVMGGVYETASGSVLATCSPEGAVGEFVPGEDTPRFGAIFGCNGQPMGDINRVRPIVLP